VGQLLTPTQLLVSQGAQAGNSPKFVGYEPPSRQKGGDTIGARRPSSLLEHARKTGVNNNQKRMGEGS
jgi:hypothetical protein